MFQTKPIKRLIQDRSKNQRQPFYFTNYSSVEKETRRNKSDMHSSTKL